MNPTDEVAADESGDAAEVHDTMAEDEAVATERPSETTAAEEPAPSPEPSPEVSDAESVDAESAPPAPEPAAPPVMETAALPDITPPAGVSRPRVPWWPFELYAIAWLALVAYAVLGLGHEDGSAPAVLQATYPKVLLGAVVLTAAGPALSIVAWFGAWLANGRRGPGLLTASLVRGAVFTLVGVLVWWGTLTLVDAVRLGVIQ